MSATTKPNMEQTNHTSNNMSSLFQRYTKDLLNSSMLDKICACGGGSADQVMEDDMAVEEYSIAASTGGHRGTTLFADVHESPMRSYADAMEEDQVPSMQQPQQTFSRRSQRNQRGPSKFLGSVSSKFNRFSSTAIDMDQSAVSLHREDTLPMGNMTPMITEVGNAIMTDMDESEVHILSQAQDDSARDPAPVVHRFFSNVDCYSSSLPRCTRSGQDLPPPISPADTYTTVSLSHSMDTLLDDGEDFVLAGDECSVVSAEITSECFRSTPPRAVPHKAPLPYLKPKSLDSPSKSPQESPYMYLLRMKPQNYIHGDDTDEDQLYMQCCSPKGSFPLDESLNLPVLGEI
eukprot:Nitzschia sp. Nitz4//scaffold127_size64804//24365//25405//NITZ4_006175-RA/size64804-processed-gene-0.16-mRNA-1//1//CDS//3329534747//5355//frame0